MIRKQTAKNLALRWAGHSPRLARLVTHEEISEEVVQGAIEVKKILDATHLLSPNKANRVEAHKARMLVEFLSRNVKSQK